LPFSTWWRVGGFLGGLAILMGTFGAYHVKQMTPRILDPESVWATAVKYQIVHSILLLLVTLAPRAQVAGICLTFGVVLFSGSLYCLVLTGKRWLGNITPFGGALMALGWFSLIF
jgi:uncharacterized membrane protein YgdD (TMEM256/DUF423 family)